MSALPRGKAFTAWDSGESEILISPEHRENPHTIGNRHSNFSRQGVFDSVHTRGNRTASSLCRILHNIAKRILP